MHINTKLLVIILCFIFVGVGIGYIVNTSQDAISENFDSLSSTTEQPIVSHAQTAELDEKTDDPEADLTPEPVPKYIFLVIGDGMGAPHLKIGDLYKKIETGDMSRVGIWESFEHKSMVTAGKNSSKGGTMLATGMDIPSGPISWDAGVDFITIMDIAKSYGFATGVVTQSDLTDATPATFLSHSDSRNKSVDISRDFHTSNVDFIMGGGLEYMFSKQTAEYKPDWIGTKTLSHVNTGDVYKTLEKSGYTVYLGQDGRAPFYSDKVNEKTLYSIERNNLPFNYLRKQEKNSVAFKPFPELSEMVQKAIDSLIIDTDGFLIMVEQSTIDDAGHVKESAYVAAEMGVMDQTLSTIMDFYNEHPDDTLVILTADHETGNHSFDQKKFEQLDEIEENLPWSSSVDTINTYLYENFKIRTGNLNIEQTKRYMNSNFFDNEFENKMYASSVIVAKVQEKLGIFLRTDYHSNQDVPLYTQGFSADAFMASESIRDVPHTICDIMGWKNILGLPAE